MADCGDVVAALRSELEQVKKERDDYKRALGGHLCVFDMADWIGCSYKHGDDYCDVCLELPPHGHALERANARTERAIEKLRAIEPFTHHDDDCAAMRFRCCKCGEGMHSSDRRISDIVDGKLVWLQHPYDHAYTPYRCDCGLSDLLRDLDAEEGK